jgi:phytoene dehydrogenase-like protein
LSEIAGEQLPARYLERLRAYRYGPGTYKLDYTLNGPIPWNDPVVQRASTVHVGASLEEIAASERAPFERRVSDAPYLIVCQQSSLDPSRAPTGKQTGYAYCHVPHGYEGDVTGLIESQIERFAPGFRDVVRERRVTRPMDFQRDNPNLLGGVVAGGVADLTQLFTRPVARLDPYSTPNPRIFLCSASTPPGGGVHGMCGLHAARSAVRRIGGRARALLPTGGGS